MFLVLLFSVKIVYLCVLCCVIVFKKPKVSVLLYITRYRTQDNCPSVFPSAGGSRRRPKSFSQKWFSFFERRSTLSSSENVVDFSFTEMNVLFGAEIARDRDAIEVTKRLDHSRILDGPHIQEQNQRGEQDGGQCQCHADQHQLPSSVVHSDRDERQESVRK